MVRAGHHHHARVLAHRPSRFDRIYRFDLPPAEERRRWLERWNERAAHATRLGDELPAVVAATEGFSFAYLKELVVGGLLRWLEAGGSGPLGPFVLADVDELRRQMATPDPDVHRYLDED